MNKFIFPFFAFIIFHLTSFAQEVSTINGKVVDDKNHPIEFSNVILKDQNNKIVKGTITDTSGTFKLKAMKGAYVLNISFLGYEDFSKEIMIDKNQDLGIITLSESENNLGEIVVTVEKPVIEKKVDRLVFNVENSITASGGNALDALRKTPGVTVKDDKIEMIGKGSVAVLMDDRIVQLSGEELVNFLRSIPSDDLKRIEVITTPPAKYDAEGSGGLINIQYKKGRRNAWNNSTRVAYTQATFPSYSLGNTFSYNKNKLRVLISADAKKGSRAYINHLQTFYDKETRFGKLDMKNKSDYFSGRFGLDYDLSKNTSVGIQYSGGIRNGNNKDNNLTTDKYNYDLRLNDSIVSGGIENKEINNNSVNLHYIQKLDSIGRKLSVDLDYFTYQSSKDRKFTSNTFDSIGNKIDSLSANNTGDQKINNYSAKIDMEHPTTWAKISYGAKVSFSHTDNSVRYFDTTIPGTRIPDDQQSDDFDYTENTQAAYFDLAKEFGKKWEAKLGLRVERTQTKGVSKLEGEKRREYVQWFPTFYLLRTINDNHSMNVNYNRRIRRPGFWELNPFRFYLDRTSYTIGNPSLQPSFTDKIELSHTYKNKLISSASFSVTTNGFGQVPMPIESTKEQIFKQENYYTEYEYGISETYSFSPFPWWKSQNQVYTYYSQSKIDKTINAVAQNGVGLYFSTNNSFTLNKKKTIKGEVNFLWSHPGGEDITIYDKPYYSLDLGLSMSFLDKKLQCSIALNDVLKTQRFYNSIVSNDIMQKFNNYYDTRSLKISLKYNFGNKTISVKEREFGNEDEKNRTN